MKKFGSALTLTAVRALDLQDLSVQHGDCEPWWVIRDNSTLYQNYKDYRDLNALGI